MQRILSTAAVLALTALAPMAHAADNAEGRALRAECAAKNTVSFDAPAATDEYRFVYSKGEYRGEARDGQSLACAEGQYAEYLASADPVRVMNAYPTAAGRPKAKAKAASK